MVQEVAQAEYGPELAESLAGIDPAYLTPVIDQIYRHASIRAYTDQPVPHAVVETIVAASQRAATSSNMQMTTAVVVTKLATRQKLAEICGNQKHIVEAPIFIAWCADRSRLDRVAAAQGYTQEAGYVENFLVAAVDVAIAMQNATLAAESLGLGTCYIGALRNNTQAAIDLLGLPELVFPIAGMTLGWPAAPFHHRPRLSLNAVLHWERYNPDDGDALQAYDRAMAETGIYGGRQVNAKGQEVENYGWMEHTARRITQPLRVEMREVLKKQGFTLK
jgi:FMN reductase (NADPH)